jgi:hypothetical protein
MSFTEIAIEMANRIAHARGCELENFSLDGVDITTDDTGVEIVKIQATAHIAPADEIPFEMPRPELVPLAP